MPSTHGTEFGELLFSIKLDSGWPLSIVWSPNGTQIAISTQGGCLVVLSRFTMHDNGGLDVQVLFPAGKVSVLILTLLCTWEDTFNHSFHYWSQHIYMFQNLAPSL